MCEHLHFINDTFAINVGTKWSLTRHFTSYGKLHVLQLLYYLLNKSISKTKVLKKLKSLAFILKPLSFVGSNTLYKVEAIGPFI